jgi:hypothetical protein
MMLLFEDSKMHNSESENFEVDIAKGGNESAP